jgi:PAS domain S-box-containing protein
MSVHKKLLALNVLNIFDALDDGVYVTDVEGATLHVNSMYEKLTGLTSGELLGRNVRELRERGVFDTIVNPTIVKTGKPETNVQTLQDGKRVVLRGFPVFDDNNELVLVITLVRDVTLMEQMRAQISQQKNLLSIYRNQVEILATAESKSCGPCGVARDEKWVELAKRTAFKPKPAVLLLGEAGVGKERFARMIHDNGPRKNEIFLRIDCGNIPEDTIESELFGYVPEAVDAFTSADHEGKIGPFEAADKGTVFLDDIVQLPLPIQARLLGLLQDREVTRVGSPVRRKVGVRVIAATSRNLSLEVEKGKFSDGLHSRLREAVVEIPPLRETPEMIPGIVTHFIERYRAKYGKEISCAAETMSVFLAYRWPGNIREVESTIQNLMISCEAAEIRPQDLPPSMHK